MQEAGQTFPAREGVADRFGQGAAGGYKRKLRFEPELHGIDNGFRAIVTRSEPVRRRLPTIVGF
jgi:hypothetical protein